MIAEIALIVLAAFPVSTTVLIIAALVIAAVIVVGAIFLFRKPGGKKGAKTDQATGAATWQPQGQQQAGWNQQNNMAQPADAWQQQQQAGWGGAGQQQAGGWGAPSSGQQQQAGWGAPSAGQQPAGWGAPSGGQQQAGWAAPATGQPQQAGWANPNSGTLAAGAGLGGGQSSWDATFAPSSQQPPASAQDQWGQPQAGTPLQQNPPAWGAQNNAPSQPDRTAYAGSGGLGQSWGQPASPPPDRTAYGGSGSGPVWNQPSGQVADPWNMAPAQQSAPPQQGWGQPAQPPSPAAGGGTGVPSWQQGQNQAGFGAGGMRQDAGAMFGGADSDKTMLRPSGPSAGMGAAPQGSMGIVRVEEGKEPGRVYEVKKETLSIGRSRESDIFLEDLAVSRLHASIVNQGNGNYALRDEGSANGTKVNGQLVNKYQVYPLNEGDKIQLGQTVLVFARR